jgi:hypothetical protein
MLGDNKLSLTGAEISPYALSSSSDMFRVWTDGFFSNEEPINLCDPDSLDLVHKEFREGTLAGYGS